MYPTNTTTNNKTNEKWRSYGRIRRQFLLQNDSRNGFRINASSSIDKYMGLANQVRACVVRPTLACMHASHTAPPPQVLSQFRSAHNTETAYVLGRRLYAFCRDALPRHPDYTASPVDLSWLQEELEVLALLIDEEQLNMYMDGEMDPVLQDDDDDDDGSWEEFHGWDSVPNAVDTDDSSNDICEDSLTLSPNVVSQVPPLDDDENNDEKLYADPDLEYYDDDDDDDEPVRDRCFLQTIKHQSVEFESDSEAADSWAQEQPDRFEQELNRHSKALQALQRQLELLQVDAPLALV